jgi:hypothetical protein
MTFGEIERITGTKLPPSAHRHRPWWSNNPKNSVMTKVWLAAGYESEQVDMERRKLVFRRVRSATPPFAAGGGENLIHPAYGMMQGLIRIAPATDLTQPAEPEWANRLGVPPGQEK